MDLAADPTLLTMAKSFPKVEREAARALRRLESSHIAAAAHIGNEVWIQGASSELYEVGSVTKVFVGAVLTDFVERAC